MPLHACSLAMMPFQHGLYWQCMLRFWKSVSAWPQKCLVSAFQQSCEMSKFCTQIKSYKSKLIHSTKRCNILHFLSKPTNIFGPDRSSLGGCQILLCEFCPGGGEPPPPFPDKILAKKKVRIRGVPIPPPFADISRKIFPQKWLKIVFLSNNHMFFCQK